VVIFTLLGRCPESVGQLLSQRGEHAEAKAYLLERQNEAVRAVKEANDDVFDTYLGLPDLVVVNIWSFAKPDLWQPE